MYNRGEIIQDSHEEQEFCMTRLGLVEESTQSFWIFCIKFETLKEHWKLSVLEGKQCCSE